jgi:hypothetical protein
VVAVAEITNVLLGYCAHRSRARASQKAILNQADAALVGDLAKTAMELGQAWRKN